ncbi:hypothetical protein EIK77_001166 [Talaromyces pinophilus]|nr:hypothetical protein EIK77_001166 [Talaromyces pinophilus]
MNNTKFQDFLSKFVLKAQESELLSSQWKDKLYKCLSPNMQHQLVQASYNNNMSYCDFIKECHQTANHLEIIIENKKRALKNYGNKGSNSNSAGKDNRKNKSGLDKPKNDKGKAKIS